MQSVTDKLQHNDLEPCLSREACPPKKMSMDSCYMMYKDAKNVNRNPGELRPILLLYATKENIVIVKMYVIH